MMNDFAKISKSIRDDHPDFSACIESSRGSGNSFARYHLFNGHKPIEIFHAINSDQIRISGNFGFFWNGHNMAFLYSDFRSALTYVSERLNLDLFTFQVNQFDHSAIVKVNDPPNTIIQNHLSIPGHKVSYKDYGKYWNHKNQEVKMYNGTRRMKQVYSVGKRKQIYADYGISDLDNLIRFEKKHYNPNENFNRTLIVEDLLNPDFINECDQDLMKTYLSIMKTGFVNYPPKKGDINASTLPLILLQELSATLEINPHELLKQMIKDIPPDIFTNHDRKERKRQIAANFKKIKLAGKSRYDISDLLAESLTAD